MLTLPDRVIRAFSYQNSSTATCASKAHPQRIQTNSSGTSKSQLHRFSPPDIVSDRVRRKEEYILFCKPVVLCRPFLGGPADDSVPFALTSPLLWGRGLFRASHRRNAPSIKSLTASGLGSRRPALGDLQSSRGYPPSRKEWRVRQPLLPHPATELHNHKLQLKKERNEENARQLQKEGYP